MSVKIGHASIDENGRAQNGKAGDQSKKEVCIRNWYLHNQGWYVLRAKDKKVAENIAKCMEDACANDCIGYDQVQRLTLYDAVRTNGFRCDKDSLKVNVETDCSALIRVCLAYAGVTVGNFNTSNEKKFILATKKFEEVDCGSTSNHLKRGDILVTRTKGHTVVVLSDGAKSESTPHTPQKPTVKKAKKSASKRDNTLTGKYKTTTSLNIREGAGKEGNSIMVTLPKDTEVECFGYYSVAKDDVKWLYVQFTYEDITYIGFASSAYLEKC